MELAGHMLIDDLSISGDGMPAQYPAVETYSAVPIMKADYYPFGMTMPGRQEYATSEIPNSIVLDLMENS